MRIVLTGAAGFIGSHLAGRLVAEGHEVVGIDAFTDYYDPRIKQANLRALETSPAFRLVTADLVTADLEPLVAECDVIFHLSGQPGVRTSWGAQFLLHLERNVLATQRLLEAVRGRGLQKLVFASSSSVYGKSQHHAATEDDLPRPVSPYGVTKLAAEQLCLAYHANCGLPAVALRYFTVYGPRQRPDMAVARFIRSIDAGEPVILYGDGSQARDFTFVTDAVTATVAAMEAGIAGQVLNVAGGFRATILDVLTALGRIMQREVIIDRQPAQLGDVQSTEANLTRVRCALGYIPKVGLVDGLREQVVWTRATLGPPFPRASASGR